MKKIGVALGGGMARAAASIGVLTALDKAGIPISFISGVSSGAIVAAAYAVDNLETIKEETSKVRFRHITKATDFILTRQGFFQGAGVKKIIDKLTLKKNFSETRIPLAIIATDAKTMEEAVISEGDITKAVMASSCLPGLFMPINIKDKNLIDGCLVNHLPSKILYELGAEYVIAVETRAKNYNLLIKSGRKAGTGFFRRIIQGRSDHNKPANIIDYILKSYTSVVDEVAVKRLKETRYDLLIKPNVWHIKRTAFYKAKELIKIGEEAGEKVIAQIKKETGAGEFVVGGKQ